jgi:hypothetical protein
LKRAAILVIVACALVACTGGASSDRGLGATMRVKGAQFVPGAMPSGDPGGPRVASLLLPNNTIRASFADDPLSGALDPSATAAAVGLDGDTGYWIVSAGAPSVATPDNPSFAALLAFAADLAAPRTYTLVVRAVDEQGTFGAPSTQTLTAASVAAPAGSVVVTLTWDTEADLDLHVVDPLGNEISHRQPSSLPQVRPGEDAGTTYGYLDFDSNAACVIDGRRQEDVIWPNDAPPGHYTVRVDTTSMCGQPIAHWTVRANVRGAAGTPAAGVSLDYDTQGPHDRGAGLRALDFDVP